LSDAGDGREEPRRKEPNLETEHFDVVVVGAGLSGISAGYHLQTRCPDRTFVILESRDCIGGTWDLFRYPGVRSDSDMFTLGYSFRPWTEAKAIADGPSILKYVRDTAREACLDGKIRFQHRAVRASWSSAEARWTVEAERGPERTPVRVTCSFLFMCSGYYRYDQGYAPHFPGQERFAGGIVHPQHWSEDIDYAGKRVVVIGSGATAVTLVPELAKTAAHVTMLQRSPTYVVSRPSEDELANKLRRRLPAKLAYAIVRWKNVLRGMYIYRLCKRDPDRIKNLILGGVRMELGPDFDIGTHFTPRYKPWDQRLCLVPDGDLFRSLREGRASMVTGQIETFTETGVKLANGNEIAADLIVTATGLDLQPLGGLQLSVDGRCVEPPATMIYKGMMYSDVPNLASAFGYTNASWTLKCDLTCAYVCRLLDHMARRGYRICTPRITDASVQPEPWVDFSSGYIQRAVAKFPKQGSRKPWRLYQNYLLDILALSFGRLEDGTLQFSRAQEAPVVEAMAAE
jgi:monooxygenase